MHFALQHLLQAWTTSGDTFTKGIIAPPANPHPPGHRLRFEEWKQFEYASSFSYHGSFILGQLFPECVLSADAELRAGKEQTHSGRPVLLTSGGPSVHG